MIGNVPGYSTNSLGSVSVNDTNVRITVVFTTNKSSIPLAISSEVYGLIGLVVAVATVAAIVAGIRRRKG